jgi:hypothetical protein
MNEYTWAALVFAYQRWAAAAEISVVGINATSRWLMVEAAKAAIDTDNLTASQFHAFGLILEEMKYEHHRRVLAIINQLNEEGYFATPEFYFDKPVNR